MYIEDSTLTFLIFNKESFRKKLDIKFHVLVTNWGKYRYGLMAVVRVNFKQLLEEIIKLEF